jgi:hypothetical protein
LALGGPPGCCTGSKAAHEQTPDRRAGRCATRSEDVDVRYYDDRRALMVRRIRGLPVTGVEATLMALAADLDGASRRTILETNGRRWHDDAADYEDDNEKWSVPGRHGYFLVLATWDKVTRRPQEFLDELVATLEQRPARRA